MAIDTHTNPRWLVGIAAGLVILLSACNGSRSDIDIDLPHTVVPTDARSIPFAPTPDPDPFYAQPALLTAPSGTILDSRSVTYAPAGAPLPNPAWQIKFVSRDVNDRPIAAVTTVVKPLIPALTSPAPLLSYQHAEDSLGSQCAPSHSATGGTDNLFNSLETAAYLAGLQTQGWTLVIPDHEGPYSEYAAGKLAGQITLDSIRAALAFAPLGLSGNQTPVGMWGYSGGAIATAWAATLHNTYAPELRIVAVASGGTPADPLDIVRNIDTNPIANASMFSVILSAVEGVNRAYPQLVTPLLNAKGRDAFNALKDSCNGKPADGSPAPTGRITDISDTSNPLDQPNVKAIAPLITLPQPGKTPIANVYVYHSSIDELVPVAGTDAMVKGWCDAGAHVAYYRPPGGVHIAFEVDAAPTVVTWLISRFSGLPEITPPSTTICN